MFLGAEVEKKKAIEKGKDELKKNEDLLKPRDMKPWEDITDMKIVEGKAKIVPKPPVLEERHAQEYDDLLSGLPQKSTEDETKKVTKTEPKKIDGVKTSSISSTGDKGKKPGDTKEEKPKLVIKRDWAKKAEDDDDAVYDGYRKFKSFDSIADIEDWTKKNVLDFEDGKMYETLLAHDGLFDNPGLKQHHGAVGYFRDVVNNRGVVRKNNSKEIGFMVAVRTIIKDVFKEKCRGLVLKNLQVEDSTGRFVNTRTQFGKFLDEIVRQAEKKDGSFGRKYLDLDRFKLEAIKNNNLAYTTGDKTGTYPIQESFFVVF